MLTVIAEQKVRITWTPGKFLGKNLTTQNLDGYGVVLSTRVETSSTTDEASRCQKWIFSSDGYIVSAAYQDQVLTCAANMIPTEDGDFIATGLKIRENDPFISFIAVCPKCPLQSPFIHRQR